MKYLKNNIAELIYLIGLAFLVIPAYMIDLKLGFAATGIIFLITAAGIVKGGY